MIISDLPPDMPIAEVRYYCSVESSLRYGLPPELVYAVSLNEGGSPGMRSKNKNGTEDLGYMQFNTSYLAKLASYGISPEDVQKNSCYSFHLAAWRLRGHLEESGPEDMFTKAAYYHSRTPAYNEIYRNKLMVNAAKFDFEKGLKYLNIILSKNGYEEKGIKQPEAVSAPENIQTEQPQVAYNPVDSVIRKLKQNSGKSEERLKRDVQKFIDSVYYIKAI